MRRWMGGSLIAVALAIALSVSASAAPADLTTLLSYFLQDLYSGVLGTTAPITRIKLGDGTAAAPSLTFASDTDTGWFRRADNAATFLSSGTASVELNAPGIQLASTGSYRFSSGAIGSTSDVWIQRDAAAVLALKNGSTAQTMRIYGSATDYLSLTYASLLWSTDGGGSLGALAANRPDKVHVKTQYSIGGTGGCTGTPTAATGGIATTCTGPEASPDNLLAIIQSLETRIAALEAAQAQRIH